MVRVALTLPHDKANVGQRANGVVRGSDAPGIRYGNAPLVRLLDQPDAEVVVGHVAVRQDDLLVSDQEDKKARSKQQKKPRGNQYAAAHAAQPESVQATSRVCTTYIILGGALLRARNSSSSCLL